VISPQLPINTTSPPPHPPIPQIEEEDDDEEECVLSMPGALLWLAVITVVISVLSDQIMSCITQASVQVGLAMRWWCFHAGCAGRP
jgi:hypothetical protein